MIDLSKNPSMEEIHTFISESIKDGGQFVFFPRGTSMLPTISPEKDCVVLIEPNNLKKRDLVLFTRDNGAYVLHRIFDIKNGKYIINGDNQLWYEETTEEKIIAKVHEIRKPDGKIIKYKSFTSKFTIIKLFIRKQTRRVLSKIKRIITGKN
jgi:hypothetical protein